MYQLIMGTHSSGMASIFYTETTQITDQYTSSHEFQKGSILLHLFVVYHTHHLITHPSDSAHRKPHAKPLNFLMSKLYPKADNVENKSPRPAGVGVSRTTGFHKKKPSLPVGEPTILLFLRHQTKKLNPRKQIRSSAIFNADKDPSSL